MLQACSMSMVCSCLSIESTGMVGCCGDGLCCCCRFVGLSSGCSYHCLSYIGWSYPRSRHLQHQKQVHL